MAKGTKRISGIYSITNKINGKRYIGLSKDIHSRWYNHKGYLRQNDHVNQYLQNAWNKHGESNFKFEVLERCDSSKLEERELYWIDKFNTCEDGYNILYGAGDYSNLGHSKNNTLDGVCSPFYVFNRHNRDFLGEFDNINDVVGAFNINYQAVINVLQQKAQYTSIFELIYKDDYEKNLGKLYSETNRPTWSKGFYIVDLMTGEYKHFYNISYAASYFGIPNENVISIRLGGLNTKYPVWDHQYWIGGYEAFHSFGSVSMIMEKYSRVYYATDCGLDNNYYSIYEEDNLYE